jgi:hypothetical protein
MFANKEVAARHLPVARGPEGTTENAGSSRPSEAASHPTSETRLQGSVTVEHTRDELDPYADVPCTD